MAEGKILIVDDELIGRQLLEAILVREGYDLSMATNGNEVLAQCSLNIPDLILLDVMMPEMNGYETIAELKKNKLTNSVPIILVTALDDRDSRIKGLEAGAIDFITKPFDRVELLAKVRNNLQPRGKSVDANDTNSANTNLSDRYYKLIDEINLFSEPKRKFKYSVEIVTHGSFENIAFQKSVFRSNSAEFTCFYGTKNIYESASYILSLFKIWLLNLILNDTTDLNYIFNFINRKVAEIKLSDNQIPEIWFVIVLIDDSYKVQITSFNQPIFVEPKSSDSEVNYFDFKNTTDKIIIRDTPPKILFFSENLTASSAIEESKQLLLSQNSTDLETMFKRVSEKVGTENSFVVCVKV
jgi:CheY-like chemotaxis protein